MQNYQNAPFKPTPESGLTTAAVTTQLTKFGKNELVAARPVPLWRKIERRFIASVIICSWFSHVLGSCPEWGLDKDHCDWRHFSY